MQAFNKNFLNYKIAIVKSQQAYTKSKDYFVRKN